MRALIQRVKHAAVTIDGVMQGQIEQGILILLGICEGDTVQDSDYLADKCTGLRIFTAVSYTHLTLPTTSRV